MSEIIDLSHPVEKSMPVYPGTAPPYINITSTIEKEGFKELRITMYTHTGTHLDAPAHIYPEGKSVDAYPLEKFIGSAIVIDCSKQRRIEKKQIMEKLSGFPVIDFILFNTGWDKYWRKTGYYRDYPLLTRDAVQYICSLSLKGLGIDAISYDEINNIEYPNHKKLLSNNLILVENLRNLHLLQNRVFKFSCFPLNIFGADGSPVRACAILK